MPTLRTLTFGDSRLPERFWAKVEPGPECWEWTASKTTNGYGNFGIGQEVYYAHRLAWSALVGPIPKGLMIDHRCRNRCCVNPAHMQVVTRKQNAEHVGVRIDSSSGVRGVYRRGDKWRVRVRHNGRFYHGGTYSDITDADAAAQALRNRLFTNNLLDRA